MRKQIAVGAILMSLLVWTLLSVVSPVRSAEPSLAILVVGDQNAGILTQREKELAHALGAFRARLHLNKDSLPIIAYHFNKDVERVYCEKTLSIARKNLLFVGIVEHDERVPQKVLFRINNVVNTSAAVDKIMAQVVERLGLDKSPASASPSAEPSTSPSASASEMPNTTGVTLLKVVTMNHQRTEQSRFLTTDRGVYVNVYLHNDDPRNDQRHILAVHCMDADGNTYGRPMGGPFTVFGGENIDEVDMVARSDAERHNGFLIKGNVLGQKPGTYQIVVELDGQNVGHTDFEIVSDR